MCLGFETSQTSVKYPHKEQTDERLWNLHLRNMFFCCLISCHSVVLRVWYHHSLSLSAPTFTTSEPRLNSGLCLGPWSPVSVVTMNVRDRAAGIVLFTCDKNTDILGKKQDFLLLSGVVLGDNGKQVGWHFEDNHLKDLSAQFWPHLGECGLFSSHQFPPGPLASVTLSAWTPHLLL